MNHENLSDALDCVRDSYLAEAAAPKKKRPLVYFSAIAAGLAVVLLIAALWPSFTRNIPVAESMMEAPESNLYAGADEYVTNCHDPLEDTLLHFEALSTPLYPTMAPYPKSNSDTVGYDKWAASRKQQYAQPEGYANGTAPFFKESLRTFLATEKDNALCSPLSIYMALAMSAELTCGNTQQQLLDTLGADSLDALRTQAMHIWNANYCDDGATTSVLASSLWLDDSLPCYAQTANNLSRFYYASVFQKDYDDPETNVLYTDWLNSQTGGLLEDGIIPLDPQAVLTLCTTVHYQERWQALFSENDLRSGIFHGTAGDTEVTYLTADDPAGTYYWGDGYGACCLMTENGNRMWLILPDEGKTPQDVLQSEDVFSMVLGGAEQWQNKRSMMVHLSMPCFDITTQAELSGGLKAMGITDLLDPALADFSPLTAEPVYLQEANHSIRVSVDEEGISAAAYTALSCYAAGAPQTDEIDIILDRPFFFVLTSRDNLPILSGVVNQIS